MKRFYRVFTGIFSVLLMAALLGGCGVPDVSSAVSSAPSSSQVSSSGTSSVPQANTEPLSDAEAMMQEMMDEAKLGKVIGCEFPVETTTIEDVQAQWGQADSSDYVASAKGTYDTYGSKNIVFGFNKGSQIFEIRNLSSDLGILTYKDVIEHFGTPEHEATTLEGEAVIGYMVSEDLRIKFVFSSSEDGAKLHHYMVVMPKLTENSMADDSGREW